MGTFYSYNPYIDYYENYLAHYGIKRKSGRYPFGSGDRPYQHSPKELKKLENKLNRWNTRKERQEQREKLANEAVDSATNPFSRFGAKVGRFMDTRKILHPIDKWAAPGKVDKLLNKAKEQGIDAEVSEADKVWYKNVAVSGNEGGGVTAIPMKYKGTKYTLKNNTEAIAKEQDKTFGKDPKYESYEDAYTAPGLKSYSANVNTKDAGEVRVSIWSPGKDGRVPMTEYKKQCDKIINKIDTVNKNCTEAITKAYYDESYMHDEWNTGKYANISRDEFKSLVSKSLSSINIKDETRSEAWYQDGKKNDMDFFSDHSITIDFNTKTGEITTGPMLEG